MILRRLTENLRAQNWTAITIEFLIVVLGVFIGTQVANWNQQRLERAETERMLAQLLPELRTQLEFYDSANTYYATTRRYADQAFAGWGSDPRVSDAQFVIAAYQASQVYGIGINPDSWALTFGGEQLRNIDDQKLRRNLELVMTADYTPVSFNAMETEYRERVRRIIPADIQDDIRRQCGDYDVQGKDGSSYAVLPATCPLKIDPAKAAAAATELRSHEELVGELRFHLASVAAYLANLNVLIVPIRQLQRDLASYN